MKIKYFYLLLVAGLVFSSCEDYLDVKSESSYNDNMVFSNANLAENAVINIYSYFGQTNSHRGRYMPYYGMNTDAEYYSDLDNETSDELTTLADYRAFSSNSRMNTSSGSVNPFTCFFNAIEVSNLCIQGIRTYGSPSTNADMAYLLGESLTLRAQFYYDLLRAWGDVPARFTPVGEGSIYLAKSDRDEIYKQIIGDLKEAADYLPWPGESTRTTTVERVNKAYALGLRARLILMASGYSQRPKTLDDPDNFEIRHSQDPQLISQELLQSAYSDLKSIISSGTCKLNATYESFWDELATDVISTGRESIFEIPFAAGRGRFFYHFGVYHLGQSPHLQKTGYGGQNCPLPTLFYEYDQADTRRDVNCAPYKWNKDNYTLDKLKDAGAGSPGFNFGRYDYERMNRVVTSNDDGVNLPVLRYADVLLMAAELANELGETDNAKNYLSQVRKRAFNEKDQQKYVVDYVNALKSKEIILAAIQEERLLEFPGEMLRKQDLIRWNILGKNLKSVVSDLKDLRNRTGKYADVPNDVFTRYVDGKLEVYGLNRGEVNAPSRDGWKKLDYNFITVSIPDNLVNNLFINDPDSRQYWPIFSTDIDSSNHMLMNNYGYK